MRMEEVIKSFRTAPVGTVATNEKWTGSAPYPSALTSLAALLGVTLNPKLQYLVRVTIEKDGEDHYTMYGAIPRSRERAGGPETPLDDVGRAQMP